MGHQTFSERKAIDFSVMQIREGAIIMKKMVPLSIVQLMCPELVERVVFSYPSQKIHFLMFFALIMIGSCAG